jgi:hypothetical protein
MTPEDQARIVQAGLDKIIAKFPVKSAEEKLGEKLSEFDFKISTEVIRPMKDSGEFWMNRNKVMLKTADAFNHYLSSLSRDEVQKILSTFMAVALINKHQ